MPCWEAFEDSKHGIKGNGYKTVLVLPAYEHARLFKWRHSIMLFVQQTTPRNLTINLQKTQMQWYIMQGALLHMQSPSSAQPRTSGGVFPSCQMTHIIQHLPSSYTSPLLHQIPNKQLLLLKFPISKDPGKLQQINRKRHVRQLTVVNSFDSYSCSMLTNGSWWKWVPLDKTHAQHTAIKKLPLFTNIHSQWSRTTNISGNLIFQQQTRKINCKTATGDRMNHNNILHHCNRPLPGMQCGLQ